MWGGPNLFNQPLAIGSLGHFRSFTIINNAVMNILCINLPVYLWWFPQKNSPNLVCLRTKPCPLDFSMISFEIKAKPIIHQGKKHMEYVSQEVVQEEGRNRFKMGLDPFQDVWHKVSCTAPLESPSWREAEADPQGPLTSFFEGNPKGFDVLGVGEVAMTDQEVKPVCVDNSSSQ